MASVDAVPVADVVTTVAHDPVEIELVPSADVPLAMIFTAVPPAPNAIDEESVPVNVRVFEEVSVFPEVIARVPAGVAMQL
jgi:hypothetical protein